MEHILRFILDYKALPYDHLTVHGYGFDVTVDFDGSCRICDMAVKIA